MQRECVNKNQIDIGKDLRKTYFILNSDKEHFLARAQNINEACYLYLKYVGSLNDDVYKKILMALDTPYELITISNQLYSFCEIIAIGVVEELYCHEDIKSMHFLEEQNK